MKKIIIITVSVVVLAAIVVSSIFIFGSRNNEKLNEDVSFDADGNLVASSGTTVKIWAYCDGDEERLNKKLVSQFNEKYKKYNIKATFRAMNASGYEQAMKTTLSSSSGPDVFLCADSYYKQFATLGYMMDLDPYIESNNATLNMKSSINEMFEGGVSRYLYDVKTTTKTGPEAHYYGLPKGTGSTVIYYNKTYMNNAGVNIISVYEEEMDAYNTANSVNFPKRAYFEYGGKTYFNNRIPMNWEECAALATKLQKNSKNKQAGCLYGFLTSWWFNYGFSVGSSCIGHIDSDDPDYNGGYYTFTLADSTVNYKVKTDMTVHGTDYKAGEILAYGDKFYLTDETAENCDVLPSQRRAFSEYMSLAGKSDNDKYYSGRVGVTDIFWELIPYKLADTPEDCIKRNDVIMRDNANNYSPKNDEKYGTSEVTVNNKDISPNPNTFSTDGRISYFYQGKVAMCVDLRASVQDCRDSMEDEWDVAPMLVYKEYDENDNVVVSGVQGAHSGSTSWCVWSKSSIPNAAYLFVKMAASEEGQRTLCEAGTIIANQKSVAYEMTKVDVDAGKSPQNLEIFIKEAEYQTPGDWWFLKDGDWIDGNGCWANYLNQTVRNYRADIPTFYMTNDYKGTFEKLLEYTKK